MVDRLALNVLTKRRYEVPSIALRSLRYISLIAAFASTSVFGQSAQQFCGPQGLTPTGIPCVATQQPATPNSAALAGMPALQQSGGLGTGIPTITNRPPSAIPQPVFGGQDASQVQQIRTVLAERNEFQDFVAQSIGRDLPLFGYNLFHNAPSTFAPVDRVPVTPEYVVGPGDEILIRAWGQVDIDYRAVVDRDGTISIPKVGNVNVAGVRFQDLQGYFKTAIGRVFRNFDLNVSMGQLRSIQIFVVGHAARPGAYTVSSLSTLVNALFASGGPTTKGSMRSIQLKRGDKLVTEFDMYDLLLRGNKSKDAQLLPGDVIYIPPIGKLAAISGSVNNPAIYELKGNTELGGLIDLAGGLAATADGQKVTVERIIDRKSRHVEEYRLDKDGLAHGLRDGDLVQVLPLSPRFDNAITVKGNVAVPARHPWRPGITVKDVIPDKESLIVPDYWFKRNLLTRGDVTGRDRFAYRTGDDVAGLPRGQAQNRGGGASDSRQDVLAVQRTDVTSQERLRAELKRTLPEVNWDYAVVERLNRTDITTQLIPFNLGKAILQGDLQNNLVLQPGDVITIFSKDDIQVPVAKQNRFVRLEGEVANPGVYQVLPGETLRQLIARVGGFTPNAYLFGSTFTRESTREMQQKRLTEFVDRFEQEVTRNMSQTSVSKEEAESRQAASQGQLALIARLRRVQATGRIVLEMQPGHAVIAQLPDLLLEDGDTFNVPAQPSTVAVVGTVYNENAFIYRPEKKVGDYLAQAGGPTKDADANSVYVIRADGTVISKRQSGGWLTSSFEGERLMPGDTVVVPENLEKFRFTKELRDWSQIFYQFALGVAGLKVLKDL
ncbi:MAG: SLBB domain-containing protein [Rhodospirillaceae bacterium]